MNAIINEIKSIIKEIENNDALLNVLLTGTDPMDAIMVKQFQRKKRLLYKELAAKLIQSNLNIQHYEGLIQRIVSFLKENEQQVTSPNEMQESFAKVGQMLSP